MAYKEKEQKALLEALESGRSELILAHDEDGNSLVRKLRYRAKPGWRFYLRGGTEKDDPVKIIIMSPACNDPRPENSYKGGPMRQKRKPKPLSREAGIIEDWVIHNLTSSAMLFISVIPELTIKRIGSIGKCEQLLTAIAQRDLKNDNVRVLIQAAKKDSCAKHRAYNARVIFLEEKRKDNGKEGRKED